MNKYQSFIFQNYLFDATSKELRLTYGLDETITFTETFRLDFDYAAYDERALDQAVQSLFFMAGVSYYKTFLPTNIEIRAGALTSEDAAFYSKTYQRGLGEFLYVNQLDPSTEIQFPITDTSTSTTVHQNQGSGMLVGLGGGKDSLVSVELLRKNYDITTWSVGHQTQLTPLVERIDLPHLWVERTWDQQLATLNQSGAYNGHVPISAILACAGAVVAILSGKRDIVVSNENSANEPNLTYQGVEINHQYSKSLEFERDFQQYLFRHFGTSVRYYSSLRPLSELRISELFSQTGFSTYGDVFSSCNRAFTHTSKAMFWCGECPKCAFVFLALTPFVDRSALEKLFNGKNLLLDSSLKQTYLQLLGIDGDKPLECVGEIKESRAAMRLAQNVYPELKQYEFDLPDGYDFRSLSTHSMPQDVYKVLFPSG